MFLIEWFASLIAELTNLSFLRGVMDEMSILVSGFTVLMILAAFFSSFATVSAGCASEISFAPACSTTACMFFVESELSLANFSRVFLRVIFLPPLCVFILTVMFESDRILGLRTLVVSSPAINTVLACCFLFAEVDCNPGF